MREDFPQRLAAKLKEVQAATRGIDSLLVEAAAAGLIRQPRAPTLSQREETVLRLLADGLSNRDIADHLELSTHTVKDHCSAVYKRLGANNRANAVMRARELGLL